MTDDNPDWTKEVKVYVESPAIPAGPFEVVQDTYNDLKANVTQAAKDRTITGNVNVISHPTGELTEKSAGVATNTSTFVSVVSRTVTDAKKYHLGKIEVPMVNAHWIAIVVDDVGVKSYYAGKADTYVMFYLYNEVSLTGNGTKKVDVKAKAVSTGETLYGYMSGEEV